MKTPVPCRCGRKPEENTSLRGYRFSFSCRCGVKEGEINFVVRCHSEQRALDNWESLILKKPYKHYVQHLQEPDMDVVLPMIMPDDLYDPDPLRRYVRAHGGHCSGGGGPC